MFAAGTPEGSWAAFQQVPVRAGSFVSCLLPVSVSSPLPFPEPTSSRLLFTSAKPWVSHFRPRQDLSPPCLPLLALPLAGY